MSKIVVVGAGGQVGEKICSIALGMGHDVYGTYKSRTTQLPLSGKPLNFAAWFVSQVVSGKNVYIVTDQIASPTLADDLARAILALSTSSSAQGIYHTAGATPLSRFESTVKMARKLGLNEALIHPTASSKFKQTGKRPLNSSLVSDRIKNEVGYEMMPIDKALDEFAKQGELTVTPPPSV